MDPAAKAEEGYAPQELEARVQRRWDEARSFEADEGDPRPKHYSLCMWPYPSGDLHVGHLRNYAIGDVWARHRRMRGFNVMQAMGWDAFGKDAELKARKMGIHPHEWVEANTANMRRELKALGFLIDWRRELASCNPLYYRWEQFIFLRMWESGLVYHAPTKVLWDGSTQTVTSRREVELGNVSKEDVSVIEMPAYQMRLRKYAGELLEGLGEIDWPEKIVKDQQYLIGRSDGMSIRFALDGPVAGISELDAYTTRPDTVMGVTYMAVHSEHPLARHASGSDEGVARFREECAKVLPMDAGNPEGDKKGLPLGIDVVNPLSGEKVPVWVADYVVDDYGSGALMGVPAHDSRDFNFAAKYGLPVRRVHAAPGTAADAPLEEADLGKGVAVNSGPLDGLDLAGCIDRIEELIGGDKGLAWRDHGLSLRDWPINRRMYWGTPIPIVKCGKCGLVPVPDEQLPVVLPLDVEDYVDEGLKSHPDFAETECPSCGGKAERETDTMDTFVNSAWYYARFCCRDSADAMVDGRGPQWLPCDHYFGGDEHAQGHLVYARFMHKVMRDLGLLPEGCGDEPFSALLCQGMVLGADGKKMSKSQENTVMAKDILDVHGADVARMYIIGVSNPKDAFPWNDEHVRDHARFLQALWQLALERAPAVAAGEGKEPDPALRSQLARLMAAIDRNIEEKRFNNLVFGGIHSIRNLLRDNPDDEGFQRRGFEVLLKVMNLVSPHIAEELWERLGFEGLLIDAPWWEPVTADDLRAETELFVVQVNGKRRDEVEVPSGSGDAEVAAAARERPNVARHLEGCKVANSKVIRREGAHGIVFFVAKRAG